MANSPMLYGVPSKRKMYGEGPSTIAGINRCVSVKVEADGCSKIAYDLPLSTQEDHNGKEVVCDLIELNMSII
ncbi:porphobilinogen synthase [Sesbania bispinosa]|nr:porphobilinogen synthase [Sesbania bispinosa]